MSGPSKMASRLSFEILGTHGVGGARLGRLVVPGRKDIETPNFIAITSRGVVPHISPDVIFTSTQFGGVHMALEDFIEKILQKTPPILNFAANAAEAPLHKFTGLPSSIVTFLTPRRTPAVTSPNGNTNTSVSLYTSTGFQPLTPKDYSSRIRALVPDIAIGLGDISYGSSAGVKKIARMADRTEAWLTELIAEKADDQAIFAPVLPLTYSQQSSYLDLIADELSRGISGLAFYDSNLLPDMPATTSMSLLPRLSLDEPSSPHQILRQISLGMDIFTVPFIGFATDAGIALTFRFPRPFPSDDTLPDDGYHSLSLGVDMWSMTHSVSLLPLSEACSCYACTSHHRAFIQHLLSAKEMLGWVLLQIHNHHVLSTFFADVRTSIKNGTFEDDCKTFASLFESELPEKSGQGPRVRGYHFKSEGPGEQKKNKPAWGNLGAENFEVAETATVPEGSAGEIVEKGFAERADV